MTLRVGLIVNPLAGVGGAVGLKGSDGAATVAEAVRRGGQAQAMARATRALVVARQTADFQVLTWGGAMGEDSCREAGLPCRVLGQPGSPTSAADTEQAARVLLQAGIDLLLFAGGDGTARNLVDALGTRVPVLGVPAGCKMHSAVYAVNPEAAGELLKQLAAGELVGEIDADVRDIDEDAFRDGVVRAKHYGQLRVPESSRYLQQVKCGGRESEDLQVNEIAAWVVEQLQPGVLYAMGSGSTVAAVMAELGIANTLLGVDLIRDGELVAADVGASQLLEAVTGQPARAVLTVIGGQGHLFGRGNQQFSPDVIRALGPDNLLVLASRVKLASLQGRPLLVDSGDAALDTALCGLQSVICGYEDRVLYRVATDAGEVGSPA